MITVVAALIEKNNKVLIARRSTGDEQVFGKWEFPGGKLEDNETELQAIEREIAEEFELQVKAQNFIVNNIYQYPNKEIDLRLYKCTYISGNFKLHVHSEYKWVLKKDLLNFDFAKADIALAKYVKENLS